jgi:aryl-alcohol dehydrogenase-like predicted oxidoreductase
MSLLGPVAASAPVGLGLAALGRPAYINLGREQDLGQQRSRADLERRAHAVLDAAGTAGVRYFDTARSYWLEESFLSSWLAGREHTGDWPVIGCCSSTTS